jgi:hypothetical protein
LTNLRNDEVETVTAGPYGRFRIGVPSDVGDQLLVELLNPDGTVKRTIDQLTQDLVWHGNALSAGDPITGLVEGFALQRATPDLRRMFQLSQMMLEPADPANWAQRAADRYLLIYTIGDMNVPINTGITLARAAGLLNPDEHQVLFDWYVPEGLEKLERFPATPGTLADPDNLDRNQDGFNAPSPTVPLRATRYDDQNRPTAGVRFPYLRPEGLHGFRVPTPSKDFDIDSFMINMMGRYFKDGLIEDDICLEDYTCDFIPQEFIPLD